VASEWVGAALVAGLPAAISIIGTSWLNRATGLSNIEQAISSSKKLHALQTPDADVLRVHYYQGLSRVVGRNTVGFRATLGLVLLSIGLVYLDGRGLMVGRATAFATALYTIPLGLFLLEGARRRLLASIELTLDLQRLEQISRKVIAKRQAVANAQIKLNRMDVWMQARVRSLQALALRHGWLAPFILGTCLLALVLLTSYLFYCHGADCPAGAPRWVEWLNRRLR
jgi:hypothetical protein